VPNTQRQRSRTSSRRTTLAAHRTAQAPPSPVPPSPPCGQANSARRCFALPPGSAASPREDDGERRRGRRLRREAGGGPVPEARGPRRGNVRNRLQGHGHTGYVDAPPPPPNPPPPRFPADLRPQGSIHLTLAWRLEGFGPGLVRGSLWIVQNASAAEACETGMSVVLD
jgi:hypothetical protein